MYVTDTHSLIYFAEQKLITRDTAITESGLIETVW